MTETAWTIEGSNESHEDALHRLAAAGALCAVCGGLCVPNIATAIIILQTQKLTGTSVPWCACVDCPSCGAFKGALRAVVDSVRAARRQSDLGNLARREIAPAAPREG